MNTEQWAQALTALGVRPGTAEDWAAAFAHVMSSQPFSGPQDLPSFLGQVLHESGMLERTEENLNYSAARIAQVWPRRFASVQDAQPYAHRPQALANKVYGGRLGNTAPDDGWRYRGRGLIQITGKNNYALLEHLSGLPLLREPDLLCQPDAALRASVVWWEHQVPDEALEDIASVTRIVNGGQVGLAQRTHITRAASMVLGL